VEIPEAFDKDALAVVKYTGDVLWCPRAKLAVQCKKTTSGDWQADFAFVSWVHDKSQLDLAINEMGFSLDFFSSDKYKVTNATAKRSEFNCPLFAGAPWVQVVYSMTIQVL
jgi:ketosteroid isomerase-like protein